MMDFFKSAWSWLTTGSVGPTLARLAIMGYASRLLTKSLEKEDNKPDKGVRLQLNPSTENIIPVLYGEAFFGGNITDAQISSDFKKMTYCITIAEVTGNLASTSNASVHVFEGVYFNDNRVVFKNDGITVDYTLDPDGNQDISARDLIKVYFYKGQTPIQPLGLGGTTPASHTVMPGWTATTHPMTNLLYAIVEVTYNDKQNINGLPNCVWHISNSMNKPGDVLLDYMKSTRYGAKLTDNEIDTASFLALNTYGDTGFSYTDLDDNIVTGKISINGVVDPKQTLLSNMTALADNTGSWLTYDIYAGKWTVIINKAQSSAVTITDSNILGEITISGTSLTQLDNTVNVQYQNTDIRDKVDFVKISVPSEELHPNEPNKTLELNLPYINKQVVAAKIGLQQLKQARVDKIITFRTDFSYLQLKAGTVISITSAIYGFTAKPFRIITAQEVEEATGELVIEFTALEYEASVYEYDITEYAVESDNGILGIGSIGKPNVPIVNKQELSNIPSIVIEAQVPSGVVSEIEFWLTYDVTILNDNARTYNLIARYSNADGSLLTEDDIFQQVCSGLEKGDFLIKCRGVNAFKSGPYSDPSGIINYVPDVVANSIDIDAQLRNSLGGLAALLTVGQLLGKVDDLLGGSVSRSIIDGVLATLFPGRTTTTTDVPSLLLEDTAYTSEFGGTINDLNNISIDELLDVDTTTVAPTSGDSLVWNGSEWVPSSTTTDGGGIKAWARISIIDSSKVQIDSSFGITEPIELIENNVNNLKITFAAPQAGNGYVVVATKGTNTTSAGTTRSFSVYDQTAKDFKIRMQSAAAEDVYHIVVVGSGTAEPCLLPVIERYSGDRATFENPLLDTEADLVPIDTDPYITFNISEVYALNKGTGTVKLYKSNGVLSQTLNASGVEIVGNKVTFPFADREYGTDYYILMDKGVVQGLDDVGTCYSPAITNPQTWNFHTVPKDEPTEVVRRPNVATSSTKEFPAPETKPVPQKCLSLKYLSFSTQSKLKDSNNQKADIQTNIRIKFNNPIRLNTVGNITLRKSGIINSTVQVFDISQTYNGDRISELFWIDTEDDKTLVLNPTKDLELDTTYYVLMTKDCVLDTCGINGNELISNPNIIRFKTEKGPQVSE